MHNDKLILVVDDAPWIRTLIRMGLEEVGFAVAEAPDAETALEVADTAPVRVLVTDLDLGPGPDGLALAACVRRRRPRMPTVYVSGDTERFHRRALAGWERFVPKPFSLGTVVGIVAEMATPPPCGGRAAGDLWAAQKLDWLAPSSETPVHRFGQAPRPLTAAARATRSLS